MDPTQDAASSPAAPGPAEGRAAPPHASPSGEPAERAGADPATGEQDDGPRPLGIVVEPTGDAAVDARLARLADADGLAVAGHIEVYEDVHRGLRDTLAALDRPPVTPRS
ncbi:hypothetical protein [Streptomyces marincola]|uniref:Uncharacterized protein n=1 Tax=Streptomyces marincola TaxID=2878388 RepID=A0A1W7D382_9ACTN|nr:hypothetical protein [Streptomyces marincola]ARQ71455.1 hypothetical protein CAG99_23845 [Streptomyces marincola]